ncbi:DNA repair protein XRCC3-like, partial [Homarus americanus]
DILQGQQTPPPGTPPLCPPPCALPHRESQQPVKVLIVAGSGEKFYKETIILRILVTLGKGGPSQETARELRSSWCSRGSSGSEFGPSIKLTTAVMTSATVEDLFINPRIITRAKITWEMQNTDQERFLHITTGCHQLDDFLGGGIPVRGLTEVTGESGSGKTQLVLQLALYAQLPPISGGLGKGVAYICTESQFSSNRLQQLISHIRNKYPKGPKSYTDNIFVHHVPDMVTAAMGKQSLYGLEGNTAPALGLSWANLVTTRLMLTRTHSFVRTHKLLPQTTVEFNIRKLEVVFCPWLRRKSFSFIVTEKGIEDIAMSTV